MLLKYSDVIVKVPFSGAAQRQELPVDDWSICTLQERTRVGPSCLKYKFRLEQAAYMLKLDLVQVQEGTCVVNLL